MKKRKVIVCPHSHTGIAAILSLCSFLSSENIEWVFLLPEDLNNSDVLSNINSTKVCTPYLDLKVKFLPYSKNASRYLKSFIYVARSKKLKSADRSTIQFDSNFSYGYRDLILDFSTAAIKSFIGYTQLIWYFIYSLFRNADCYIFTNDRTTSSANIFFKAISFLRRTSVLIQTATIADTRYYVSDRISDHAYMISNNILSNRLCDHVLIKDRRTSLLLWSKTETLKMFFLGILPRKPLSCIGSLGHTYVLCTDYLCYLESSSSSYTPKGTKLLFTESIDSALIRSNLTRRDDIFSHLQCKYFDEDTHEFILLMVGNFVGHGMLSVEEYDSQLVQLIDELLYYYPKILISLHPTVPLSHCPNFSKKYSHLLLQERFNFAVAACKAVISTHESSLHPAILDAHIPCLIFPFTYDSVYSNNNISSYDISFYCNKFSIQLPVDCKELSFREFLDKVTLLGQLPPSKSNLQAQRLNLSNVFAEILSANNTV